MKKFKDRIDDGRQLAGQFKYYQYHSELLILGTMGGGAVIAKAMGDELGVPSEPLLFKSIVHPVNSSFEIGVVGHRTEWVWNFVGIPIDYIRSRLRNDKEKIRKTFFEIMKQDPSVLHGRSILLVEDGQFDLPHLQRVLQFLGKKQLRSLELAVPVLSKEAREQLVPLVDQLYFIEKVESDKNGKDYFVEAGEVSKEDLISLYQPKDVLQNDGEED